MKRAVGYTVFALVVLIASVTYQVAASPKSVTVSYEANRLVAKSDPLKLDVSAYAIFDVETGEIISAYNDETVLPIASVTKLITAAATTELLPEEKEATISYDDVAEDGRSGRLSVGERYTTHELLFPLLLESSNDAAATLERIAEGTLVEEMNELVAKAGAKGMVLSDTSGLSSRNVASARDLATVASYLYKTEPHIFDITRLSKRAGPYVGWTNNSPVLETNYRGGKHGYTEAAKRTLVALYEETYPAGKRTLGYVVLGSENLRSDMEKLRLYTQESVSLE
jgi:D-alanyl-D-alanine carboxypeptidase